MADIVNLRRFRKARNRADAEKSAAQNRLTFGRRKADRAIAHAEADQAARLMEGHRLIRSDDAADNDATSAD